MRWRILGLAFLTGVSGSPALAQETLRTEYEIAYQAWQDGDYMRALSGFETLLNVTGGETYFTNIALLTGELFHTWEVVADGRTLRWSPDGRLLSYETTADGRTVTHVVRIDGNTATPVAVVEGRGVIFSPSRAEVAYVGLEESPDGLRRLSELRAQVRDRESLRRYRREVARVAAEDSTLMVRSLETGEEHQLRSPGLGVSDVTYSDDGTLLFVAGRVGDPSTTDIWAVTDGAAPRRITNGPGIKQRLRSVLGGTHVVYMRNDTLEVVKLSGEVILELPDIDSPVVSADGESLAFLVRGGDETTVNLVSLHAGALSVELVRTRDPIDNLAIAADGRRVAFQMMPREDWEIYVVSADGLERSRLTHEIQHDLFPEFLPVGDGVTRPAQAMLAVIGEERHRRSYLYDLATGERIRLFHNNTVRTVAPEYEWAVSPDGSRVAIVSERDGDTISPERGVYVVDLTSRVTKGELLERIADNLVTERDLRNRGHAMFAVIGDDVRAAVADVSTTRIYGYEADLFGFGSKFITRPGNAEAIEYIVARLRSFGYEPELQWFEPRPGIRTANVIATLPGTVNPELVYVISSHFDSVERGPGADDNTSGSTALLEAARVLADRPMPATIKFAFFTAEETGLRGSREFVRRAVAADDQVVGALNNDMIGFANDARLDNTIRYSNVGIRDVQHAAAFLFTDLITYDAKYYKSTDAHAYYEAYGDIVGGIGSYPILGNPHYHRSHDVLETINHQLVAEVSKTTVATIMLLASSPSRLTGVEVSRRRGTATVRWNPAVESGIARYVVVYGPSDDPTQHTQVVTEPGATLRDLGPGTVIAVKAVNARGLQSWDWARVVVN